jgi:predicted dehydrogenase
MSEVMSAPPGSVGLLVGYGSVGAHHGRVLAARYGSLAVVESSPDARARATEAHPEAVVAGSLDELAAGGWDLPASRAAIATWGPSHAPLVDDLLDRGVRHLLVEKPMASSIAAAHTMIERSSALGARLGVHLQRRVSGLVPGIHRLAEAHGLGPMVAVTVDGGARCLVTNGMHWLDLACALLDALPTAVTSTARGQAINPRSPDLLLYEGNATWEFPDDRSLSMTFTNRSSVDERLRFWYRNGVIDLTPAGVARVATRPAQAVEAFPAVTRTGPPSETGEEGPVADVLDAAATTTAIWAELDGTADLTLPPATAAGVLGACIGALVASAEGRRVDLPIDPESGPGREEWPIS